MKRYVKCIVAGVLLIAAIVYSAVGVTSMKGAISQAALAGGNGETKTETKAQKSFRKEISEITGYDNSRRNADDKAAEGIFRTWFTWEDYDVYNENRQDAIEKGIPEDSRFMETFFPEAVNLTDKGNMQFGSMETHVIGIDGDRYSYFAELDLISESSYKKANGKTQKTAGTGKAVILYTMDEDGNISDVDGYTMR